MDLFLRSTKFIDLSSADLPQAEKIFVHHLELLWTIKQAAAHLSSLCQPVSAVASF